MEMTLNAYQGAAIKTSNRDYGIPPIAYFALGLSGEAGEAAEKVKKLFRDDKGVISGDRRDAIVGELGDALWYLSAVAYELGVDLDDVARKNLEKIESRTRRGVRGGEGDNR